MLTRQEINNCIQSRITLLEERITNLEGLKNSLVISGPCKFKPAEIPIKKGIAFYAFLKKSGLDCLDSANSSAPFIYYFTFQRNDREIILEITSNFRAGIKELVAKSEKGYSFCHIPGGAKNSKTSCLYLGSVIRNIKSRIFQHLGLGHYQTYSMHLNKWPVNDIELELFLVELKENTLTTELEAAFSDGLKPLIGRQEK